MFASMPRSDLWRNAQRAAHAQQTALEARHQGERGVLAEKIESLTMQNASQSAELQALQQRLAAAEDCGVAGKPETCLMTMHYGQHIQAAQVASGPQRRGQAARPQPRQAPQCSCAERLQAAEKEHRQQLRALKELVKLGVSERCAAQREIVELTAQLKSSRAKSCAETGSTIAKLEIAPSDTACGREEAWARMQKSRPQRRPARRA